MQANMQNAIIIIQYRTNSQKLIAFILDLNRERDIKDLIEDEESSYIQLDSSWIKRWTKND